MHYLLSIQYLRTEFIVNNTNIHARVRCVSYHYSRGNIMWFNFLKWDTSIKIIAVSRCYGRVAYRETDSDLWSLFPDDIRRYLIRRKPLYIYSIYIYIYFTHTPHIILNVYNKAAPRDRYREPAVAYYCHKSKSY